VRVTLQSGKYKGHIAFEIGGNCLGKDLLEFYPDCECQEDVDKYVENDCEFMIDDEDNMYFYKLHNDDEGNTCCFESDLSELEHNIVAIEIINCVVNKEVGKHDTSND
jgi:hypothetical protein